jgi:Protein of unknown function (DUF2752)
MTVRWRQAAPGALDRALIGASVVTATAGMAAAWLHWFGLPPLACPLRAVTGIPCPTCGATRAFASLIDGHVAASFRFNPAVPLAAVASLAFVPYVATTRLLGLPRLSIAWSAAERRALRIAAGLAVMALWTFLIVTRT